MHLALCVRPANSCTAKGGREGNGPAARWQRQRGDNGSHGAAQARTALAPGSWPAALARDRRTAGCSRPQRLLGPKHCWSCRQRGGTGREGRRVTCLRPVGMPMLCRRRAGSSTAASDPCHPGRQPHRIHNHHPAPTHLMSCSSRPGRAEGSASRGTAVLRCSSTLCSVA